MNNDGKAMVNSSPNSMDKGRTVEVDTSTENGTANSPIAAYYEFPSSKVTQQDPFAKRSSALSDALGNKDQVRG